MVVNLTQVTLPRRPARPTYAGLRIAGCGGGTGSHDHHERGELLRSGIALQHPKLQLLDFLDFLD